MTDSEARVNARDELKKEGFIYGWLTDAYSRPNFFYYEEHIEHYEHFKLYTHPVTKNRVIATKTGQLFYLTN